MFNQLCTPVMFCKVQSISIKGSRKTNDLKKILSVVLQEFEVTEEAIKSKRRFRELADARKAFYYLCSKYSSLYGTKATRFINQHHSTGIYGVEECINLMKTDVIYRKKVECCQSSLLASFKGVEISYE